MVNVTESVRLGKTPLLFRLHSCSYPDPLTNRVPGQDYPIEERQWLLGTTYNTGIECLQFVPFLCYHPPILDPSMPSRMFGASIRPSAYSILVSPVSEHGLWPRSSSDYLRVFSCCPVARRNSTKPSGGSNQRLCCADLFPTALRRLRRYVMDFGPPIPKHHHHPEAAL